MTGKDLEKEAEIFVSEKADKGNFDVEKFGKAYFSESSMKQALVKFAEKQIAELEKEVTELKGEANSVLDNWCRGNDPCPHLKKRDEQLTKAKELLKRYVPYRQITDSKAYKDLADETEQFLNSEKGERINERQ